MMKPLLISFMFSLVVVAAQAQLTDDTTAIKQLLDTEAATWRSGDAKAHADCWHIQPYSKVLVSTTDGKSFDVPAAMILQPSPGSMGNGGTSIRSNYVFSIHGDNAWIGHDEISTSKDGAKAYSHEIRILEKFDGKWKLVAQSIHLYKPE